MKALRKPSLGAVALGVFGLVVSGEGWCLCARAEAARKAQAGLEQKRRELHSVAASEPAPTAATAGLIEADLARTTRALESIRASLTGRGPAAELLRTASVPARRPDAYFDIAGYVEKMRAQAQRYRVALQPEERFGFAEYANVGPEAELIPAVFRERLIAQYLLEALFETRPRQLLAVQRERPLSAAERAAVTSNPAAQSSRASAPDCFEIDPRASARIPGFVEATAFRLSFVGHSAVLRALLNKLAALELPLVVRSVEVEPAVAAGDRPIGEPAAAGAVQPLVRRTYSRFAVTVEFIELPPPIPEA